MLLETINLSCARVRQMCGPGCVQSKNWDLVEIYLEILNVRFLQGLVGWKLLSTLKQHYLTILAWHNSSLRIILMVVTHTTQQIWTPSSRFSGFRCDDVIEFQITFLCSRKVCKNLHGSKNHNRKRHNWPCLQFEMSCRQCYRHFFCNGAQYSAAGMTYRLYAYLGVSMALVPSTKRWDFNWIVDHCRKISSVTNISLWYLHVLFSKV